MKATQFFKVLEVLKKQEHMSMSEGPRRLAERALNCQIWNNLCSVINYIVLHYNPMYEINIYAFILIND